MSRPRSSSVVTSLIIGALLLLLGTSPARADFPKPSPYPISWELKFTHGLPKRIVVNVPNSNIPQAYWYMTYTVTNLGDKEQMFLPRFELMTEDGRLTRGDVNIPRDVFDAIKAKERNKLLEPVTSITGLLRLGEAEARDGVAIFPEPTPRMGHFSIFVTGLSGEAVTLKNVNGEFQKIDDAEQMKNPKDLIILRKTLQLNFFIRGDEVYPGEDEVNQDTEVWIMR